ncbi:VOC family protein [Polyangium jinanense]|uniref:VOC family protein n=1 Tax=Polyangium jinanense TaxID=2829994 RepID=A0A9X3X913_9BACT|nr:VOC family protein [Polyangium jinanense]MDC3960091.1 VOC family protein [Polyangium jinanense]MDC3984408.1 VOC family protein [Polyangium jinanense]
MLKIDHIGLAAHDAQTSARDLAAILGAPEPTVDGADDDMYRIDLEHGAFLLFNAATIVNPEHIAFRVDAHRFAEVVKRLEARGLPFGNEPDDPRNGKTEDPLGGAGRVYFVDANGHLFEVTC